MLETTSRSAGVWPSSSSSSTRRNRKRDSKIVFHAQNSRCSPPRNVRPGSSSAQQMDFFNPSSNNAGNFGYNPPIVHQGGGSRSQNGSGNSNSWQQSSSLISYTLASHNGANSPTQMFDGANAQSPQSGFFLQLSDSDLGSSWTGVTHANGDLEDIPTLDIPYESYDDSLGLSSPTTAGTSSSEGFVFPVIDSTLGTSPSANRLFDLDLSGR